MYAITWSEAEELADQIAIIGMVRLSPKDRQNVESFLLGTV
jgi:hypothetical protein